MGGGLVAEDFKADHSEMDLSEFIIVPESSSEDGSSLEATSDFGLQLNPARLLTDDDPTINHAEFPMVPETSQEDDSVLKVTTCDLGLQQKPEMLVTDESTTDPAELPMLSETSPENNVSVLEVTCDSSIQPKSVSSENNVLEVTCDSSLQPKSVSFENNESVLDPTTDPAEVSMVTEPSPPENVSVLEVNCDLGLQKKPTRTLVLLGRSGNGKSATGNSILGRQGFKSKGRASGVTSACELQSSTLPDGQILNVIDTPGLFSLSPSTEFTCREIINCLSLSKEGIDAVLVVFSLRNRLTEEEKSALIALEILFGSKIVDYMIVVFTNEDALEDDGDTFEDYLTDCSDFKDILKACKDRKVLFENRSKASESQKAKQVKELLNYVEEIGKENGKSYFSDLSHKIRENETAFQERQREVLEMKGWFTKQEMSQMMKDMAKSYENQQLNQMKETMDSELRETKKRLEEQLNEEKVARLELEKNSCNEVKKLREDLERADKMTKELKEKIHCIIL